MGQHQLHYLAVAIGIATIVAIVARARNLEDPSLASSRPVRKASIWVPLKNQAFRNLWFASFCQGVRCRVR